MVRRFLALPIALALALPALALHIPAASARTTVTALRLGIHEEGVTRFVMDVSESLEFRVITLTDPLRVVVETPAIDWATEAEVKKPLGWVRGLRYEGEDKPRIVLDLKAPAAVKGAFVIPPRDGMGWRFVLDLKESTRDAFLASAARQPAPSPAAPPVKAEPVKAEPVKPAPGRAEPNRIVVVSPNAVAAAARPEPVKPEPVKPEPAAMPAPEPRPMSPDLKPMESRTVAGAPMLSAPMPPPPPARPAAEPAPQAQAAAPAPIPAVAPAPPSLVTPAALTLPAPAPEPEARAPRDGIPVVVIDPGHGGVDPGAIGVSGIYEKFITLAVARELKTVLEKSGRYRVHLTRDRDVFIRLRDRIAFARQVNADLFISLHADAVQSPQIRGLSVYTLSQNASDSEAQALAEKENKADLIAGIDLSHESADVANILIDLAQRETMNRSAGFAGEIVDEVGRDLNLLGNTHRFAGFAVLKAPDVPSVLVEMGYLSHEIEERELRQPQYRTKLAKSVARAVERYFAQPQKAKRQ